ncbi:MAG: immunoglobulin domain-containing protein [Ignavibacteriae bacterium]|nr:immunoglobulin domain-containing protein [Ignavibacteriota bacterium]
MVYHSAWGDPRGIASDWFEHNGSTVTHIIHFKVDPLNIPPYLTFDGGPENHARNRVQIISDAHARGIKVLLCIGGVTKFSDQHCTGTGGADMWECITSDSILTETVLTAMSVYARTYGYDGFDLDWEAKFNATNLGFLLRRLRAKLDSWPTRGILSIATGRTASSAWPIATMNATCDYINIMLYDGNAYWSCNNGTGGISGFHEPLFNPAPNYSQYCWDGSVVNSEYCLSTWESAGIDKSKTSPSIAFYGWSWKGVTAPGQRQSGCSSACAGYASYMDAKSMLANGGTYHYDNLAQQAWVSLPGATYSYVNYIDETSVTAKMNYYRSHGWGGVMCFANEHAADISKPNGSDAKFPLLTAVRNNLTPPTPSAPAFTSQPANQTVLLGDQATFSVSVSGYPTPALQWQKNSVDISGAIGSSYTTPVVGIADNGISFRCVASNSLGTSTSSLSVLTVNAPLAANPVSDDFSDPGRFASVWRMSNSALTRLVGTGTNDAALQFNLDGTTHDLWINNYSAPKILQDIPNGNFDVVAKFQTLPANQYQMEGIIVKENANSWLRFDFLKDAGGLKVFAGHITNSGGSTKIHSIVSLSGGSAWLKVNRSASTWTMSYSQDNVTYTQAGQFNLTMNVDSIGVFAGNSGSPAPPFVCNVDYFFNTSNPLDPEDPTNFPTGNFSVNRDTLPIGGGDVILNWTSSNAVSATIDPGIGAVALSGSVPATVGFSKTFVLTLTNSYGSRTYAVRVGVPLPGGGNPNDVTSLGTPIALITAPTGSGSRNIETIRDGISPAQGSTNTAQQYDTYDGGATRSYDWIGYTYGTPQTFGTILLQEGIHSAAGGYFSGSPKVEVRVSGQWIEASGLTITPAYNSGSAANYTIYTLQMSPTLGDGIRVAGVPGGTQRYISVGELRVFSSPTNSVPPEIKPKAHELTPNFPNPFNPTTTFSVLVGSTAHVQVKIYNLLGQVVRTLADEMLAQGTWKMAWDGHDDAGRQMPSGVYLYRMQADDFVAVRKMVFAK